MFAKSYMPMGNLSRNGIQILLILSVSLPCCSHTNDFGFCTSWTCLPFVLSRDLTCLLLGLSSEEGVTGKNSGRVLLSDTGCNITCQLLALWDKSWRDWCDIDHLQQWSRVACWSWSWSWSLSWCHVPEQQPALSADNRWFRWSHLINPFTSVIWCCQLFLSVLN